MGYQKLLHIKQVFDSFKKELKQKGIFVWNRFARVDIKGKIKEAF